MTALPEPECRGGYTWWQIRNILGERTEEFQDWMYGQTMMLCNADPQREWRDAEVPGGQILVDVGPSLCAEAHGGVVYPWDLARFIEGRPIID